MNTLTKDELEALAWCISTAIESYHPYNRSQPQMLLARSALAKLRQPSENNVLKEVTSDWYITTENNGYATVPCHSRMIEGVLCRWWGDGPVPKGVALINAAVAPREE